MLQEIIYRQCGIDIDMIPESKQIDCTKVIINESIQDKIIKAIQQECPEMSYTSILLVLLIYGPSVQAGQSESVILEEGYIIDKERRGNE